MSKFHAAIGLIMVAAVSACGSSGSSNSPAPSGGGTSGETSGGGNSNGGSNNGGGNSSNGGSSSGGGNGASTVTLSDAPGAGSGAIQASTLGVAAKRVDAFNDAVQEGKVGAPSETLTGRAKMDGYVSVASLRHDSINEEYVVGNLTIDANFDNGTLRSTATDFAVFDTNDIDNPRKVPSSEALIGFTGGELSGTGTIDRTQITSELNGTLRTTRGNAAVDSDLVGGFLDNDDQLVVTGQMAGTITFAADGQPRPLEEGSFFANE